MTPLVSVIIPGYNHAPYLRERIDSVMAQDYSSFEVIMLDDCSPDGSAEIMQSYADIFREGRAVTNATSVTFHPNSHNTGNTFLQWEKGISLAKGEYVWIAESDDVAKPEFLSRLMSLLTADADAVIAFSHSLMIGPDSQPLDYSWDETHRYKAPGVYDGSEFCLSRLVYKNLLYNASMIVFRRSAYYAIGDEYKQYRHSGDWLFWFGICMQGKVCEVPETLNSFRQHPAKVSNNSRKTGIDLDEMAAIQHTIARILRLSRYQMHCLRGRQTKRLRQTSHDNVQMLSAKYPDIYAGSFLDTMLYTIDKLTNWSHLQR